MKAIRIHQNGGPEVLTYEDVPDVTPGPGEVLIKVAAVGVNYADLMQRQGVYPLPGGLPVIPGFEVAGTVAAVGDGVTAPAVGTRVVTGIQGGGYAEYAVAPAFGVFPIPDSLDFAKATALFLQGLTARGLLREAGRLQKGETVLIHSAAGGVGSLAVQLAKLMGAGTVIGTASTSDKLALVQQLGADIAIDYTTADWAEQVMAATDGKGASIILDAVGGEIGAQSLNLLAQGGRLVVYGAASGQPTMIAAQQLSGKGLSVVGYSMVAGTPPEQMAIGMHELLGLVAEGQLEAVVGNTYSLRDAAKAHQAIAERRTTGKLVLLTEHD